MRFMAFSTMMLMLGSFTLQAAEDSSPKLKNEIIEQAINLGELMRHDVETVLPEKDAYTSFDVTGSSPNARSTTFVIIPLAIEGRGGGNVMQEYVALYQVMAPDEQRLEDDGYSGNPHKNVALLAFVQIDRRRWKDVDWSTKKINGNSITVDACEDELLVRNCPIPRLGTITLRFSSDLFGPNLMVANYPP